ncbi:amidohydrolase [Fusobacterium simiae]|uniref:Amidohydrolase n=1 Tax=Fusobacterium simiae TaxID=855 RepID=A0ABT4DEX1_FUSSI|nr:amidohydrolase [Fusobacterium simiae]MCY7007028.1 amidohydrolase [Fusobacterium simiae]
MLVKKILDLAKKQEDYIINMRRTFHKYPELSGEEFKTRELIIKELENLNVPYRLLSGTGIIATIEGKNHGKNVLLRADIDALPVKEEKYNLKQVKECVSEIDGICHACGHDAHMAILLGAIRVLKEIQNDFSGTVYCCFEEGEETNCGIDTMIEALKDYSIDKCFGLHVYNKLEAGKINIEPGPRMAGAVGIGFDIIGKGGHGSRPDLSINPIIPAAHIITQINSAFINQITAEETVTLGIGMLRAGEATNIIPDRAYIGGTARFFNKLEGEKALKIIETISKSTALSFNCDIEYEKRNKIILYPVINDEECVLSLQEKLKEICGEKVLENCDKWYASETYSRYLEKYPGVLAFLGIKNNELGIGAEHHNSKFDIDESSLVLGVCAEVAFVLSN